MKLDQLKQEMGLWGSAQNPHQQGSRSFYTFKGADRNKMGGNCEDCKKWAEEMYWTKFKVVHFFSVLTKKFRSHLKFPSKFVIKCLANELADISTVTLKGTSGKTWNVELTTYGSDGELYLRKGWGMFVKENKLKENDVLLFKYKLGSSLFDVLMFDAEDSCEKERLGSVRNHNFEGFRGSKGYDQRNKVDRGPSLEIRGCNRSKEWNEKKRVEREPSIESIEPKRVHHRIKRINISDDDEEEVCGRMEPINIHHPHSSNPVPDFKGKALVPTEREDDKQVIIPAVSLRTIYASEKSKHAAYAHAVREGSRRGAPHFVVLMKASHVLSYPFMSIPVTARRYIPSGAEDASLRMNDETWPVKLRPMGKAIGFRGTGWVDFICRNNIAVGDACLFEITSPLASLSRSLKDPVIITVSVFRSLEDA